MLRPDALVRLPLADFHQDNLVHAIARLPHAVIFDSRGPIDDASQWCFAAADPIHLLTAEPDGSCAVDGVAQDRPVFEVLKTLLETYAIEPDPSLPPFAGGVAGIVSYEMGGVLERLPEAKSDVPCPALSLGIYDVVVAFNRATGQAEIISTGWPEMTSAARHARATNRAAWLKAAIDAATKSSAPPKISDWQAPGRDHVISGIKRVRDYIGAGDIFQANITQAFTARRPEAFDPVAAYDVLSHAANAPFSAFVDAGSYQVLSVSPERFLKISADGRVETRPIKGTRPRGTTPEEDQRLASELMHSEKDKAENLMIVDLLRNDLSRTCRAGSVAVPVLQRLESFPAVHHLVSVVTGRLDRGMTAVDQFAAAFPGGSVTGAPKIRAMEIIHEIEPVARGAYCGSIAWFGFDGAMDSSIVIRTAVVTDDRVTIQAGGGIVWDSDPAEEYDEAVLKAQPLIHALGGRHG